MLPKCTDTNLKKFLRKGSLHSPLSPSPNYPRVYYTIFTQKMINIPDGSKLKNVEHPQQIFLVAPMSEVNLKSIKILFTVSRYKICGLLLLRQ